MLLFPWSAALKLGIETLDNEHKVLVDAMNELHVRLVHGHGRQGCLEALDAMREYAHTHFLHEEALMAETGFPRLAGHRDQHRRFAERVEGMNAVCLAPEAATAEAEALLTYLRDWLMDHILGSDMLFAAHYKARRGRMGVRPVCRWKRRKVAGGRATCSCASAGGRAGRWPAGSCPAPGR